MKRIVGSQKITLRRSSTTSSGGQSKNNDKLHKYYCLWRYGSTVFNNPCFHPEKTSKPLIISVLFTSVMLVSLSGVFLSIESFEQAPKIKEMQQKAYDLTNTHENLKEKTENQNTINWVKKIAKEEFNLVDPQTLVFVTKENISEVNDEKSQ